LMAVVRGVFQFSLNENGKANGMKMKAISPLTDFSFDFQDLDFKKQIAD